MCVFVFSMVCVCVSGGVKCMIISIVVCESVCVCFKRVGSMVSLCICVCVLGMFCAWVKSLLSVFVCVGVCVRLGVRVVVCAWVKV